MPQAKPKAVKNDQRERDIGTAEKRALCARRRALLKATMSEKSSAKSNMCKTVKKRVPCARAPCMKRL